MGVLEELDKLERKSVSVVQLRKGETGREKANRMQANILT